MNISDIIENFLLKHFEGDSLIISRNELADFFDCAPSQINYVLSTRFTLDRGYVIESKRGGGGSITVFKISGLPYTRLLNDIIEDIGNQGLAVKRAFSIIDRIREEGIVNENEAKIIRYALDDKALVSPIGDKDKLRASVLKNIIRGLLKGSD